MRPVCTLAVLLFPCLVQGQAPVTVLLEFEQPHSMQSVLEMERETQHILKSSGLKFNWRLKSSVTPAETFSDVVVVRMNGQCRMDSYPVLLDERGPLAFTHSSDGAVLPFSQVMCDKVRRSVSTAMTADDREQADKLYGRALGRVLAHEMFHIFAQTADHGEHGVAKTALSGAQLIGETLPLDRQEVKVLRAVRQARAERQQ